MRKYVKNNNKIAKLVKYAFSLKKVKYAKYLNLNSLFFKTKKFTSYFK